MDSPAIGITTVDRARWWGLGGTAVRGHSKIPRNCLAHIHGELSSLSHYNCIVNNEISLFTRSATLDCLRTGRPQALEESLDAVNNRAVRGRGRFCRNRLLLRFCSAQRSLRGQRIALDATLENECWPHAHF